MVNSQANDCVPASTAKRLPPQCMQGQLTRNQHSIGNEYSKVYEQYYLHPLEKMSLVRVLGQP